MARLIRSSIHGEAGVVHRQGVHAGAGRPELPGCVAGSQTEDEEKKKSKSSKSRFFHKHTPKSQYNHIITAQRKKVKEKGKWHT